MTGIFSVHDDDDNLWKEDNPRTQGETLSRNETQLVPRNLI